MLTVLKRRHSLSCVLFAAALLCPALARADYHIFSPDDIDYHEFEFEHNGDAAFDKNPAFNGQRSYTAELGYGFTEWWHPELEFDFEHGYGDDEPTNLQYMVWENTIRLTEPGENWADVGFYAEYDYGMHKDAPNGVLFGPLVQKDIGRTTHTLNLFFDKELGPNQATSGTDFSYQWQSRWNVFRQLSPAFEIYGDAGQLDHVPAFQQQQFLIGPVALGSFLMGDASKLKYEVGYLFGATDDSSKGTVRWRLEWETHF